MTLRLRSLTIHVGLGPTTILFISAVVAQVSASTAALMDTTQGLQKVISQFSFTLDAT